MPALGTSLLELIRRTAWDLPADVDHALETALKGEEPGTNGEATLEMFIRAAVRARQEKIPLGGDPAALRFTVDAPPGFDRDAFRAAADSAAHTAAEEGILRTDMVDLPGGRPRRGMQLGAPPVIVFRDVPAPAAGGSGGTRISLRIVSYFEAGATAMRTLPGPGAPGVPTLDGVVAITLAAIHEQQGRPAGPGLIGIHIGADPVSGLAAAEAELLRPVDDRNPQRPLAQLEARITERVNQLGIGPLALGGKTTILGTKIAVDPAPADRWAISIAMSSWALRRHTVTIAADGSIRSWETALDAEGAAKSAAKLAARFAARKAAEKAAEKAEKAEKAARAAAKIAAAKPAPRLNVEGAILGGRREEGRKSSSAAGKSATGKSPPPRPTAPKPTSSKSAAPKSAGTKGAPPPVAAKPGSSLGERAPAAAAAKGPAKPVPLPTGKATPPAANGAPKGAAKPAASGAGAGKSPATSKPVSQKPLSQKPAAPKPAVAKSAAPPAKNSGKGPGLPATRAAAGPSAKSAARAPAKPTGNSPQKSPPPKSAKKPEKRK